MAFTSIFALDLGAYDALHMLARAVEQRSVPMAGTNEALACAFVRIRRKEKGGLGFNAGNLKLIEACDFPTWHRDQIVSHSAQRPSSHILDSPSHAVIPPVRSGRSAAAYATSREGAPGELCTRLASPAELVADRQGIIEPAALQACWRCTHRQ